MLVFNTFWKIAKKEKVSFIIYFAVFFTMSFLFIGSYESPTEAVFEQEKVEVCVIDRDNSFISRGIRDYFTDTQEYVEIEDDIAALQNALFFEMAEYVIIIPEGFGESFLNGGDVNLQTTSAPNSYSGIYIDMYLEQFLSAFRTYSDCGLEPEAAYDRAMQNVAMEAEAERLADEGALNGMQSFSFYYRFVIYLFMALFSSVIGTVIMAFNNVDVAKRMKCSALKVRSKNFQLALGCGVVGVALWAIVVIISLIMYGSEIMESNMLPYLMLNSGAAMLFLLSIAFLIGIVVKNESQISMFSTTASLAIAFLSGVFVDLSIMSESVLKFSRFLPTYWYVRANDVLGFNTVLQGADLELVISSVLIQVSAAAAIFVVAMIISKKKNGRE